MRKEVIELGVSDSDEDIVLIRSVAKESARDSISGQIFDEKRKYPKRLITQRKERESPPAPQRRRRLKRRKAVDANDNGDYGDDANGSASSKLLKWRQVIIDGRSVPSLNKHIEQFYRACHMGDLQTVREILDKKLVNANVQHCFFSKTFTTPLHVAAMASHAVVAQELIRRGAITTELDGFGQRCVDMAHSALVRDIIDGRRLLKESEMEEMNATKRRRYALLETNNGNEKLSSHDLADDGSGDDEEAGHASSDEDSLLLSEHNMLHSNRHSHQKEEAPAPESSTEPQTGTLAAFKMESSASLDRERLLVPKNQTVPPSCVQTTTAISPKTARQGLVHAHSSTVPQPVKRVSKQASRKVKNNDTKTDLGPKSVTVGPHASFLAFSFPTDPHCVDYCLSPQLETLCPEYTQAVVREAEAHERRMIARTTATSTQARLAKNWKLVLIDKHLRDHVRRKFAAGIEKIILNAPPTNESGVNVYNLSSSLPPSPHRMKWEKYS